MLPNPPLFLWLVNSAMKTFSQETTVAMKGFAIIFIMLHNFLHINGFSKENETVFYLERTQMFFQNVLNQPLNVIGDVFSFIGWVGVPVFVFLSGYGLERKYHKSDGINTRSYIKHSYLKLFWLLLPAASFYFAWSILVDSNLLKALNNFVLLTMLNNFVHNMVPIHPGVYWYFGLTFQLYLLFLLLRKLDNIRLLMWGGICIVIQMITNPTWFEEQVILDLLKNNFVGWLPFFVTGMIIGRKEFDLNKGLCWLLMIVSFALVVFMNVNYYLWLFIPFASILMFYCMAKIATTSESLFKKIIVWVGTNSAFIFVSHPIARTLIMQFSISVNIAVLVLIYVVIALLLSIGYRMVNKKLLSKAN